MFLWLPYIDMVYANAIDAYLCMKLDCSHRITTITTCRLSQYMRTHSSGLAHHARIMHAEYLLPNHSRNSTNTHISIHLLQLDSENCQRTERQRCISLATYLCLNVIVSDSCVWETMVSMALRCCNITMNLHFHMAPTTSWGSAPPEARHQGSIKCVAISFASAFCALVNFRVTLDAWLPRVCIRMLDDPLA